MHLKRRAMERLMMVHRLKVRACFEAACWRHCLSALRKNRVGFWNFEPTGQASKINVPYPRVRENRVGLVNPPFIDRARRSYIWCFCKEAYMKTWNRHMNLVSEHRSLKKPERVSEFQAKGHEKTYDGPSSQSQGIFWINMLYAVLLCIILLSCGDGKMQRCDVTSLSVCTAPVAAAVAVVFGTNSKHTSAFWFALRTLSAMLFSLCFCLNAVRVPFWYCFSSVSVACNAVSVPFHCCFSAI